MKVKLVSVFTLCFVIGLYPQNAAESKDFSLVIQRGHISTVNSIVFHPDGEWLASGSADGTVKLWTLEGRLLRTLRGNRGGVRSIALSPDGKTLASSNWDKCLLLWDVKSGTLLNTFEGHSGPVRSVAFSPNGKLIVSGAGLPSGKGEVFIWDTSGKRIRSLSGHGSYVNSVAFHPSGKLIASSSDTGLFLHTLAGERINKKVNDQ